MCAGSSMKFNCLPFRREFIRLPIEWSPPCPNWIEFRSGLLNVFVQHTSASLTINENADPDVVVDLNQSLAALAPEDGPYRHMEEGADDMPAHVKASLDWLFADDTDPQRPAIPGYLARYLSVRAPSAWRPAAAGVDPPRRRGGKVAGTGRNRAAGRMRWAKHSAQRLRQKKRPRR